MFPDNSFYKKSVAETGVADTTETVEKPVQKSIRKAKSGEPESLPLKVEAAADGKTTYKVGLVYAEPLLITSQSELLTNVNKRQIKQAQQADEINTKCANIAVYNWGPTGKGNILSTSGAGRASHVVGLTGQRKKVTKEDMLDIYNLMLRMNVGSLKGNWYGLVTSDFYTDLLGIEDFVNYEKTGFASKLEKGIVGNILGVDIMVRTTEDAHAGLIYTNASTPVKKAVDAEIVATDRPANLFWNDKMVCHAEGSLRVSINPNAPGYLGGTIIESWVRFGADIVRDDQKGVIAMLESNV